MNRLSAIDAFSPAFTRVKTMLFQSFRLGAWLKMGFIGALGGGVAAANANFNFRGPMFPPRGQFPGGDLPNNPWAEISRAIQSIHLADYVHLIVTMIAVIAAISLVFLYLFARFRFVLFDSVIAGQPTIGRGWQKYASQANRYFGFWLVFRLVQWAAMALIIGMPLWHAYKRGAFSGDNSLIAFFEIIASIALGVIAASIVFGIISTLAKDFIMPMMALDDLAVGDAWASLWRVIQSEPGSWAAYLGMKLICAIGTGIALSLAFIITLLPAFLIIGIPVGIVVAIGAALFKAAGAVGIVFFCLAALLAIAGCMCWYLILTAPVSAFFPSYALYFFGGRYPKLGALLMPQQTPPPAPVPQMAGTPAPR